MVELEGCIFSCVHVLEIFTTSLGENDVRLTNVRWHVVRSAFRRKACCGVHSAEEVRGNVRIHLLYTVRSNIWRWVSSIFARRREIPSAFSTIISCQHKLLRVEGGWIPFWEFSIAYLFSRLYSSRLRHKSHLFFISGERVFLFSASHSACTHFFFTIRRCSLFGTFDFLLAHPRRNAFSRDRSKLGDKFYRAAPRRDVL